MRVRHLKHWALNVLVVIAALAWAVWLRPAALGGSASYVVVSGHSMEPTLWTGDLVVARRHARYGTGEVVVYTVPKGDPGAGHRVIHRIVGGSPRAGYITQGDNRDEPDYWRPRPDDVAGRQWVVIPKAGLIVSALGSPPALAAAAGLLTFLGFGGAQEPKTRTRRRRRSRLPVVDYR